MATQSPSIGKQIYTIIHQVLSIITNLIVIVGVALTFNQVKNAIIEFQITLQLEKQKEAIDAINLIRTKEFLETYTRFKKFIKHPQKIRKSDFRTIADDYNYLQFVFDYLAILFLNDTVNKCLIKQASLNITEEYNTLAKSFHDMVQNNKVKENIKDNSSRFNRFQSELKTLNCN